MKPRIWATLTPKNRSLYFDRGTESKLRAFAGKIDWRPYDGLSPAEQLRLLQTAQGIITCRGGYALTPETLAAAEGLKIVGVIGSSVKHVSPEPALARGVTIVNSAAGIGYGVAEFTVGTMITALHTVFDCLADVRRGGWGESVPMGRNLAGRSIGLVGVGAVGRQVVELLKPFHVTIRAFDPYLPAKAAKAMGITLATKAAVFRESDVVSIHCGLTPETTGLIGARELALMKPGALLINTARGPVIQEPALLRALKKGRIMAALDVFCDEPLPKDSPFRSLPNCIATPHRPGGTMDTYLAEGSIVVEDFARFFRGRPMQSEITREKLLRMT